MRFLVGLLLTGSLMGCGAVTQYVVQDPNLRLRQYHSIYVKDLKTAGAMTNVGAGLGSSTGMATGSAQVVPGTTPKIQGNVVGSSVGGAIAVNHAMSGSEQWQVAEERLKFKLAAIGFNVVEDETKADIVAELSLGTVRFDPIGGWIADQATMRIYRRDTAETILRLSADKMLITPTVEAILRSMVEQIRRMY